MGPIFVWHYHICEVYHKRAVFCIQPISKRKKLTEIDNKNSFKGKWKVVWSPGMPMIIKLHKKVKPKDFHICEVYHKHAVFCIQRISKRKKFFEIDNKNSFKAKWKVVWSLGMPMIIKLYKKVKPKDLS